MVQKIDAESYEVGLKYSKSVKDSFEGMQVFRDNVCGRLRSVCGWGDEDVEKRIWRVR